MTWKDPDYHKKWLAKHPGYNKAWQSAHPDYAKTSRGNRPESAEYGRLYSRKYRLNHPNQLAEWKAKNPGLATAYERNRRSKIKDAEGTHTGFDIELILDAQDYRCYYCDEVLDQTYHVDHKQPLSRGGSNDPSNLCCACPSCNLRKHDATESEFILRQFAGSTCST